MIRSARTLSLLVLIAMLAALPGLAQTAAITAADYARAEKFMGYNVNPLVLRSAARPNSSSRFFLPQPFSLPWPAPPRPAERFSSKIRLR